MFTRQQNDDGNETFVADGGGSENGERITEFAPNVDAAIGRGATDTDQTYLRLRSPNGSIKYLVVADDNTVSASGTKP